MRRSGVGAGPVDQRDAGLLVGRPRVGEVGDELVEQRPSLGQSHREQPTDLRGVPSADGGVELAGGLGLELGGLRR